VSVLFECGFRVCDDIDVVVIGTRRTGGGHLGLLSLSLLVWLWW
jgi:hypothetical protein